MLNRLVGKNNLNEVYIEGVKTKCLVDTGVHIEGQIAHTEILKMCPNTIVLNMLVGKDNLSKVYIESVKQNASLTQALL